MSAFADDMESVLNEKGWIKGKMVTEDGVCLVGAYRTLLYDGRSYPTQRVKDAIRELFPERSGNCTSTMPFFNDHPDTTREDVSLVIKHAGYKMEEEERRGE